MCGFPEITLDGSKADWQLLREKAEKLLSRKVERKFGEQWKRSLLPILDRFIAAFDGDTCMVFWNSMVYRGQWSYVTRGGAYGRGAEVTKYRSFVSGWINVFYPYVGEKKALRLNEWAFEAYRGAGAALRQYQGVASAQETASNEVKKTLGPRAQDFPVGLVDAPVVFRNVVKGTVHKMKFHAGFVGFEQDTETLCLSPVVGWFAQEDNFRNFRYDGADERWAVPQKRGYGNEGSGAEESDDDENAQVQQQMGYGQRYGYARAEESESESDD